MRHSCEGIVKLYPRVQLAWLHPCADLGWFLAEMEASPEPRQVVLKWALHPTIGPKLKGNAWLEKLGLQQPLAGVYSRLRALEYAAQL